MVKHGGFTEHYIKEICSNVVLLRTFKYIYRKTMLFIVITEEKKVSLNTVLDTF